MDIALTHTADDISGHEGVQRTIASNDAADQNENGVEDKDVDSPLGEGVDGVDPTNLIVNYIPVGVTEDQIRALFATYGQIEKVKIVNDKFTGYSLGYGFVKFTSSLSAQAALALNGHTLMSKRLKVSISKPPLHDKRCNLYISGLPVQWGQSELEQLVSSFGQVVEVRVLYDNATRKGKGVGFARFADEAGASACINALSGNTVDGGIMPLNVKYADTTSDKVRKAIQGGYQNVYSAMMNMQSMGGMGKLNPQVQAPSVISQVYGNPYQNTSPPHSHQNPYINSPPQHHSPISHNHHPHGQLSPPQQTQQNYFHSEVITHPQLSPLHPPQPMHPISPHSPLAMAQAAPPVEFTGVCLFVYHLPLEANESTLFQLFGNYGVVSSAKVMRDLLTGRSKGFGFVNVLNEQMAQSAIQGLNGFQLGNKYLKVAFKK